MTTIGIGAADITTLPEWIEDEFGERMRKVQSALTDQESVDFFLARKKTAGDADVKVFAELDRKYSANRRFTSYWLDLFMKGNGTKRVIIITEEYYSDTNRCILELCGKNVAAVWCAEKAAGTVSFEELVSEEFDDCTFVIAGVTFCKEFAEELKRSGIPENRLFYLHGTPLCSGCRKWQYFDFWKPDENEVFADCGAYAGETDKEFIDWTGGNYGHIYAFEPLQEMADTIRRDYSGEPRVSVTQAAVWSRQCELEFCTQEEQSGSGVDGLLYRPYEGVHTVPAVALDDVISGRVTFIKMDIEGSELEALKGARRIISGQKPRLAISIYHKPMDFLLIPEYILSLVPEYKMAIRHYGADALETVLYAWV